MAKLIKSSKIFSAKITRIKYCNYLEQVRVYTISFRCIGKDLFHFTEIASTGWYLSLGARGRC